MSGLKIFTGASAAAGRRRWHEPLVLVVGVAVAFAVVVAGGLRFASSGTSSTGSSGRGSPGPELARSGPTFEAVVLPTAEGNDAERGRLGGTAIVTTNADDELCLSMSVTDVQSRGVGHLHRHAGEVVLAALSLDAVPVGSSTTCTNVDDVVARELVLRPGDFEVEVHLEHRPMPAARGGLVECPLRCSV